MDQRCCSSSSWVDLGERELGAAALDAVRDEEEEALRLLDGEVGGEAATTSRGGGDHAEQQQRRRRPCAGAAEAAAAGLGEGGENLGRGRGDGDGGVGGNLADVKGKQERFLGEKGDVACVWREGVEFKAIFTFSLFLSSKWHRRS